MGQTRVTVGYLQEPPSMEGHPAFVMESGGVERLYLWRDGGRARFWHEQAVGLERVIRTRKGRRTVERREPEEPLTALLRGKTLARCKESLTERALREATGAKRKPERRRFAAPLEFRLATAVGAEIMARAIARKRLFSGRRARG